MTTSQPTPKPAIVVFTRYYLPGYKAGGALRTVANMVAGLRDAFRFRVICSDRDAGDPAPYSSVAIDEWNAADQAAVYYAPPAAQSIWKLRKLIREAHPAVVYLNSFFDPVFTLRPLLLRRLGLLPASIRWVLAPRGEFSPAALALKARKKTTFMRLARFVGLYHGLVWQASSEYEQRDIERAGFAAPAEIMIAPDMTTAPPTSCPGKPSRDAAAKALRICFISRITPMKNLDFAIEVLRSVRCAVIFDIYGPADDEDYTRACQTAATSLGSHIRVGWHPQVPHHKIIETFSQYDLFLFPSRGENFGHVVFESLAAGTPVLASDRTPWRDLDTRHAGWVRSLDDKAAFVDVIERVAAMSADDRAAMSLAAWRYSMDIAASAEVRMKNRALFETAMASAATTPAEASGSDHDR